jgi:hypothetical protein
MVVKVSFPDNVWDGTNAVTQRNASVRRSPDRHDYDQIAGELIATQTRVLENSTSVDDHENRVTNLEAVVIADDSVLIVETSIDYEVDPTPIQEMFILVDATAGDIEITLPDPAGPKFPINVKKIDGTAHRVIVLPYASEYIDGGDESVITSQWTSGRYIPNGTDWFIV